jgi:hypothetical protein
MTDDEKIGVLCAKCNRMSYVQLDRAKKYILKINKDPICCSVCDNELTADGISDALIYRGEMPKPSELPTDPETKVDKRCVGVLKAEGFLYRIVKRIFYNIPLVVLSEIIILLAKGVILLIKCFIALCSLINWCIVKSILRMALFITVPASTLWFFWQYFNGNLMAWVWEHAGTRGDCSWEKMGVAMAQRCFELSPPVPDRLAALGIVGGIFCIIILGWVVLILLFDWINKAENPEAEVVKHAYKK